MNRSSLDKLSETEVMHNFSGEYADSGENSYTNNRITGILRLFQEGDEVSGFYCVWRSWEDSSSIAFSSPGRSGSVTGRVVNDSILEVLVAGTPVTLAPTESGVLRSATGSSFSPLEDESYVDPDAAVKRLGILQYLIEEGSTDSERLQTALHELVGRFHKSSPEAIEQWAIRQQWICDGLPASTQTAAMRVAWQSVREGQGSYVPVPPELNSAWREMSERMIPLFTQV